MNPEDNTIGLSRRKVLVGLGAVGVASAGAGLGTTAYFSDQESFEGNELQAGTLALNVTQSIHTLDQDGIGPDEETYFGSADGPVEVEAPIVITDAKPGDEYEFCWEVELEGNPGFAMVTIDGLTDQTGAEAENVFADDLYDVASDSDMITIGEAATATATLTLCEEPDGDEGDATPTGEEIPLFPPETDEADDSLGAFLETLSEGLPVPADFAEGDEPDSEFDYCHGTECPVELCVTIDIDEEIGNKLQGAESAFDLHVYAEQCRHNDVDTFTAGAGGDSE